MSFKCVCVGRVWDVLLESRDPHLAGGEKHIGKAIPFPIQTTDHIKNPEKDRKGTVELEPMCFLFGGWC